MNTHLELAIRALRVMRSDDAERARRHFAGLTQKQMQEQYGNSGMTRAELLANYERSDAEIDAAIAWLNTLPEDKTP